MATKNICEFLNWQTNNKLLQTFSVFIISNGQQETACQQLQCWLFLEKMRFQVIRWRTWNIKWNTDQIWHADCFKVYAILIS